MKQGGWEEAQEGSDRQKALERLENRTLPQRVGFGE